MQTKANDTPKIIALGAGIVFFLGIAAYQYLNANRPAASAPTTSAGVPAQINAGANSAPSSGATGTPETVQTASSSVPSAKPGQMRQFDPYFDELPENGMVPAVTPLGRANSFVQYKPATKPPIVVSSTPPSGGRPVGGGILTGPEILPNFRGGAGGNSTGLPTGGGLVRVQEDNIPQQEMTLEGVVTGADGFAVVTVREPGRADTAIPDQQKYVRLGEDVAPGQKLVSITETGVRLSKSNKLWLIGTKYGFTRQGVMMAALPADATVNNAATSRTVPPTQTP